MTSNIDSRIYLWLDSSVNETEYNLETQQELRRITKNFQALTNCDECEQYIRKFEHKNIVLIVSGKFGQNIMSRVHDLPQLIACYVFCSNIASNGWAHNYSKIKAVVIRRDDLVNKIIEGQSIDNKAEENLVVSVINSQSENFQVRNAKFIWFQLFIEILLRMHHKSTDRKELIECCRKTRSDYPSDLEIIDEFEKTYSPEKAITWYTRHSCLYKTMNQALRAQDFDTLFSFRVLIADIAKQIKCEYEKFILKDTTRCIIKVYRGQSINVAELELMKNNIGEYVSMNSFLSTSYNRAMALSFASLSSNCTTKKSILFEIEIDPKLRTKPFADISKYSAYHEEREVLIMIGALFRINEVTEDVKKGLWIAKVSLADEDDYGLKEILSHMKEKIGDDTNLDSLGKLLLRMDENEQARKWYRRMLEETQLAVADAQLGLGWASMRCKSYKESLEHFEQSLQIRQKILGENHSSVGEILSFIGEVYRHQHNYEKALIELNKAKTIQENSLGSDSLDLAATYDTIANIYTTLEKYDTAFEYYNKVLNIRQKKLPADHPQIAALYNNLGWAYESSENYKKSLEYYNKSLDIGRKTLPPNHRHIINAEKSIQNVNAKLKNS